MSFSESAIQDEIRRIESGGGLAARQVAHFGLRLVIRTLRIAAGLALLVAALWIAAEAWDLLGRPFAAQSILGIVGGVVLCLVALAIFSAAFASAFGAAPAEEDAAVGRRAQAIELLKLRLQQSETEKNQGKGLYDLGRSFGRLFSRRP